MDALIILTKAPYGTELSYHGLRMADAFLKLEEEMDLTVYLLDDAVLCAKAGQVTPNGYYNIERMLRPIIRKGSLLVCETCMEARGIKPEELMEGARVVKLGEAATLALDADKVLTF